MAHTAPTFEELFGVPGDTKQFTAIDLQSVQNQLRFITSYIEETRSIHTDDTAWIDELLKSCADVQKQLRDAEVDHAEKTQEVTDPNTGEIHDVFTKEVDEVLFDTLTRAYRSVLMQLKAYVDSTIVKLHAAGKLDLYEDVPDIEEVETKKE